MTNEAIHEKLTTSGFVATKAESGSDIYTSKFFRIDVDGECITISTISKFWVLEDIERDKVRGNDLMNLLDRYTTTDQKEYYALIREYIGREINEIIDTMHSFKMFYETSHISLENYEKSFERHSLKYNNLITIKEILQKLEPQ